MTGESFILQPSALSLQPLEAPAHPWLAWTCGGLAVLLGIAWLLYLAGPGGDYDRSARTRLGRAWRRALFALFGVRGARSFPWIVWEAREAPRVSCEEALAALPLVRPGDVGLHRRAGRLANLAVPGFMKHAWLHVDEPVVGGRLSVVGSSENRQPKTDNQPPPAAGQVVEAVREGVLRRSALYPFAGDYVVILRPREVTAEEAAGALRKAAGLVGCGYDVDFRLDVDEELERFRRSGGAAEMAADYRKELEVLAANLRAEWDGGFSSTEAVGWAWWHVRRRLRLYRKKAGGKHVILPDDLINGSFEIVWASGGVTAEAAERLGLSEEGVDMIRAYREAHPAPPPAPAKRSGARLLRRIARRFGVRVRG